jgi:hypothetical protein
MSNKCRCKNTARYLLSTCPDQKSHGRWEDYPRYVDSLTIAVEEYHEQVLSRHNEPDVRPVTTIEGTPVGDDFPYRKENAPIVVHAFPASVEKARPVNFVVTRTRTGTLKSVTFSDEIPASAANLVKKMIKAALEIHISRAVGTWSDANGDPATKRIMEQIEGTTPTGKPKTAKVGEEILPPQVSVLVRGILRPDRMFWGHWVSGDYVGGGDWQRGKGTMTLGMQEVGRRVG